MKKKLAKSSIIYGTLFRASVTTLALGSPSANNSSTTTSQTTTAKNRSKSRAESNHTGCIERCSERKIKWIFHRYGSN